MIYTLSGSAFCFLSSVYGHQTLAVCFAGFINVNSALCLFYHFYCFRYFLQLWDLEKSATLVAVYPSVSGTAVKQPGTAASWALSDNLHRYIPYTNPQDTLWWSRIQNKEHLLDLTLSQNILPTEPIVIHQKFPSCPIISPEHKRYCLRHNKTGSIAKVGKISLDLSARICYNDFCWGDGMRKRISCRVIRTIPLSVSSDELRHAGRSNDKSHKISNTARTLNTKKCVWEPAANAQVKHFDNSVRDLKAHKSPLGILTYTDRLDIKRMSINDGLTAQILDFYV